MDARFSKIKANALLVLGVIAIGGLSGCNRDVSDEDLLSSFSRNRADYRQLQKMAFEDTNLIRMGLNWIRPSDLAKAQVTAERVEEYKELLEGIGSKGFFRGEVNGDIFFIMDSQGLVTGGTLRGIAHLNDVPTNLVAHLSEYKPSHPFSYRVFQRIDDGWYLFKRYDD